MIMIMSAHLSNQSLKDCRTQSRISGPCVLADSRGPMWPAVPATEMQVMGYSSTCHERPPPVRSESGPSWQVALRGREQKFMTSSQKHTCT